MTYVWGITAEFAVLFGISLQKARRALARLERGLPYRGIVLEVRRAHGVGGERGQSYQFKADSLPAVLKEQLKALRSGSEAPSNRRDDLSTVGHWRLHLITPALDQVRHTGERAAAVREIARTTRIGPDGRPITVTERTIERWLDAYEADGIAGLMPRARRDKGARRVVISERWDGAVPFDQADKEDIADALRTYVRGLHKEGTSAAMIGMLAATKLRELTAARCDYTPAMSDITFKVPLPFIAAERAFRNVAIFKKDRKAYEDARPRIRRTRDGLAPLQIVVGDVHHLDIVMRRPDGSEAWPKAIAWLDLATNRTWLDVVLLGKGKGIRNADVIASFVRMVQDWGMPRTLYLDNGSEYRWSEFIDDALKLVERIDGGGDDRDSRIVRARPYNAPAKAIEGIFRVLEYTYFCHLPGWAGGDRTNKKTAKVGQPTEPFAGTLDELRSLIGNCLALYESKPQRGALGNRSPRAVYEAAVADGWQRVTIDARELRTVFAEPVERKVRQGAIEYGGQYWICDVLNRPEIKEVIVRVPKFEEPTVLPVLDLSGKLLGFAEPVKRYGPLDPAGAREAARIAGIHLQGIQDLDRAVPDIDVPAEITRAAEALPATQIANVVGVISVSDQAREIADGIAEPAEDREARRIEQAQAQARKEFAKIDRFSELMNKAQQR